LLADATKRKLERLGRERDLIYKTFVLTGLRLGELASLTVRNLCLDAEVPHMVLEAAHEKNRQGSDLPLRDDLALDIRAWLADKLKMMQETARRAGEPIPIVLPPEAALFHVPKGLRRILDRDLVAAGIARKVRDAKTGKFMIEKRDERGRTIDVHALRTTFGTHLSKGGVAPRTAQAAMRHSDIKLTMGVYTEPKLLDVRGALDVLPRLPLGEGEQPRTARATGTDGAALASQSGKTSTNKAKSDHAATSVGLGAASADLRKTPCLGHEKGSRSTLDREPENGPGATRTPDLVLIRAIFLLTRV